MLEIRCTERIGVGSIGVKAVSFFTGLASEGDGVDGTRWKNWELRGFCASENDSALESLGDGWKLSLRIGDSAYFKDLPFGTYTRRWDDDMVTLGRTILALAPLSSEFRCMNESRWGHATPRMVQHRIARNNIFVKPVCQCTTSTWWASACTFNHTFTAAAAAAKINEPFARFLCDSLHYSRWTRPPKRQKPSKSPNYLFTSRYSVSYLVRSVFSNEKSDQFSALLGEPEAGPIKWDRLWRTVHTILLWCENFRLNCEGSTRQLREWYTVAKDRCDEQSQAMTTSHGSYGGSIAVVISPLEVLASGLSIRDSV